MGAWSKQTRAVPLASLSEEKAYMMWTRNYSCSCASFVELDFYLPRPKTVKRQWPTVRPDADKLLRAVLDLMTKAGVYCDDACC